MNEWLDIRSIDHKMSAIIDYLYDQQGQDGEFRMLRFFLNQIDGDVEKTEYERWYQFGKCPFCTATILFHLQRIHHEKIEKIIRRGCEFLLKGIENGLVRYLPAYDSPIIFPADMDDTSMVWLALEREGRRPPDIADLLLNNTDSLSNFYTWFTPRVRYLRQPLFLFWLIRDRSKYIRRMKELGTGTNRIRTIYREYQDSSELAVQANVLLWLGMNAKTEKYLDKLIQSIENDDFQPQYYTRISTYFHVARLCDAGFARIQCVKNKIISYIESCLQPNGEVEDPFHTALAALILIYFDCWDRESLNRLLQTIFHHEMHNNGWRPFHYCNDRNGIFFDGGAELTATFYLEVLNRHREKVRCPPQ